MFINFIDALKFASEKHIKQRKRGCDFLPYINHPIKVVNILFHSGESDFELLTAALLHDVLEDTNTTDKELQRLFGHKVRDIVEELTDDMNDPYDVRKKKQIKNAPYLSTDAKKIKIA